MANNYWIKLYIEILDDPKMGRLTAEQWRLAIELFLLAGEQNKNGILPSLPDMAWRLRIDENELLQTMSELEQVGILSQDGDAWIVTNFARRQDKISDAERSKAWRERAHKKQYYGSDDNEAEPQGATDDSDKCRDDDTKAQRNCNENDTTRIIDTDIDIDTETDTETDKELTTAAAVVNEMPEKISDFAEIAKVYQAEIGIITPFVREDMEDAMGRYPRDWIIEAIKEAAAQNVRKWKYAESILQSWKVNGFKADMRNKSKEKSKHDLSEWRDLRLQNKGSGNGK